MKFVLLGIRSLAYRPLNTFLSVALLGFGLGLVLLLSGAREPLEDGFTRNIKGIDLVVGAKGSPLQIILSSVYHVDAPTGNIPLAEFNALAKDRLVKKAIPLAYGDNYQGFRIVGTRWTYAEHYRAKLAEGRRFEKPFEVCLGSQVAERSGLALGDHFHSQHGLQEESDHAHDHHHLVVKGILAPSGTVLDQLMLTPLETVWAVHDHSGEEKPQEITAGLLQFQSPMATMTLPRRINKNTSLQAALPAIEINRLFTLAAGFSQLLQGLGLLILLLALVSVFAALLQSFRDEEPQLAYLRVLGARPSHLFVLILSKGLSLCALGYLAGLLLSQLGLFALGRFLSNQYHYRLSSQLLTAENLWLLAGTLLLGFVAALWPAWRAFRLNISNTLTHA